MNKYSVPIDYTHTKRMKSAIPGRFITVYCKGAGLWWSKTYNKWLAW